MDNLSEWTDVMITTKLMELTSAGYEENERHRKRITEINTQVAELQKEKIRRSVNKNGSTG